ncbi:hypothetical protein LEP1GSC055_0978 [Leptospira borgpetersenii str. Brem 307]|uniref:SLEI domain protein, PF07620 family n=1 Tax=Leptospira borgpetersenii str. Brem 328 TaxID=1049780 RepID=A0ABC9SMH8_LEPBO|nr:hypothetical protein LEP1GSC055_0978 [Leptospira borgpetersenii str. Brem 307]EMN18931.1 hypothetical protein LEP1GSC056_1797 [Leptospira borgpetersenii str. Brem 328]
MRFCLLYYTQKTTFKRFLKNCIEFSNLLLRRNHAMKVTNENLA